MDGVVSREPPKGAAALRVPFPGKDDSAISMFNQDMQGRENGLVKTQPETDSQGDVEMGDADATPRPGDVPASLRPGSEANRVIETSKGLWSGPAMRR
jgi:hypothetical protein